MNKNLIDYLLSLADTTLILSHRNSEWCGHGPVLEQDIALTNISLDLIGQSRNFYQYAARLINEAQLPGYPADTTEDTLAYLRDVREFRNCLLAELPNGDWAQTILRQFFFSAYQYYLYKQMQENAPGRDEQLGAIAVKSLKEVSYHLRWSSEWVIRLGDGTPESHTRMLAAIDNLWSYTGELFMAAEYENGESFAPDLKKIKANWLEKLREIFTEATLPLPKEGWMHSGGKKGLHTEHLGYILADLQFLQRTYPGCEW